MPIPFDGLPSYHGEWLNEGFARGWEIAMLIALSLQVLSSLAGLATFADILGRIPVADSVAEFSDVQGRYGWQYGYFEGDPPFEPDDFREFPDFIGRSLPQHGRWVIDDGPGGFWTEMSATACHPNGKVGGEGRQRVIHWAVRRWKSHVDGPVELTGMLFVPQRGMSNGVIARIFVDGVRVWQRTVPAEYELDYSVATCVSKGSLVDFTIDPRDGDDWRDFALFTAEIFWLPRGDLNCDCSVDTFDIEPFLLALFDPEQYARTYPECDLKRADINQDGAVDAFDIEPFLELLFP
jgi:hypothetical protein